MAIQECYIFFLLWKLICFLKKQAFWKHVALEGTHVCGWAKWRHHFMDVCMLFFIPRWLFRDFQVAVQSSIYRWRCFQKDVKKVPKVSKGAKKAISWVYLFHFLHLFSFFLSFFWIANSCLQGFLRGKAIYWWLQWGMLLLHSVATCKLPPINLGFTRWACKSTM